MNRPATTEKRRLRQPKPKAGGQAQLAIRVVSAPEEVARFDRLLEGRHYLGRTPPIGDFLRQVAEVAGEWVGLLAWGASAYRLKDRDEWIGWTNAQRSCRRKLVVQNRRFLLPAG